MAPINPNGALPGHAPNIDTFLKSVKLESPDASAEKLVAYLQRRQISGPEACAKATLALFLRVVKKGNWQDANSLLERIQRLGRRLIAARPQELSIGNVTRRVMGLIRDEAAEERNDDETNDDAPSTNPSSPRPAKAVPATPPRPLLIRPPTLSATGSFVSSQNLLHLLQTDLTAESEPSVSGASTPLAHNTHSAAAREALRSELADGITELLDEIGQADDQIASFADSQIHPGETVLVYRPTPTVEKFLIKAASKRKFTVMIAGVDAPLRSGASDQKDKPHAALRERLAKLGTQSIILAGGGIMQHMPVVTKVVLDARGIVPSGGVVAENGAGEVARAARRSRRTVIFLGAVYKIAPAEPPGLQELLETSAAPMGHGVEGVEVRCPELQYVTPEKVDLYISNLGPNSKQQLQAIITDHYKKEDVNFS